MQCVGLTEFWDSIIEPIFNFLKFQKPILLRIPRGLWSYNFFQDILILRGQNNEKIRVFFFNFLIQALLRPQNAIWIRAIISRVIFSWFWPFKIKISWKKLYGHNPLGMLNHIGFQNFKKVEFWLKNRHIKNVV